MRTVRLSDEKIEEYEKLGLDLTYRVEDEERNYTIEVNERIASWIERSIEFGRKEAKRELNHWLTFGPAKVK